MIKIMQECHQELEVTDMMQTYNYDSPSYAVPAGGAVYGDCDALQDYQEQEMLDKELPIEQLMV